MFKKITLSLILLIALSLTAFFTIQKLNPTIKPSDKNTDVYPDPDPNQVAIPIVIVIDPGHGAYVGSAKEPVAPNSTTMKLKSVVGATGNITRVAERDINMIVGLQLRDLLTQAGYTVIMTHTDNTVNPSNIERATIANDNKANLMIRIHNDSSTNTSIHGASVLVPGNVGYAKPIVAQSRMYGQTILDTLLSEVGMASRGVVTRTDQTGFNWSKVPVITVEMGFLSNAAEEQLITNAQYQTKLANALFTGIKKCFPDAIPFINPILY